MVGMPLVAPGRIDRIEVANFKSYRGEHTIGPFKNFTAVIGPNGSGKSNLMDAISFVLGVRTAHLRGSLKELLYTNSESQGVDGNPRRGSVKLIYITGDGEAITFARNIAPASSSDTAAFHSQYQINGRTVSWEAYNAKLKSFGILVKARNFLVFQGDIESVAAMKPKDLTNLFEAVSGSEELRQEYEEQEAAKVQAEEHTSLLFGRRKNIMQEKKQKKEQKQEAEKHMALLEKLDDLKVEYYLWQLYHIDEEVRRQHLETAGQQAEIDNLAAAHAAAEKQLKAKKAQQAGFVKERMLLERKVAKKRQQADKKSPQNVQAKEELVRLGKRLKAAERELADKREAAAARDDKIAKLKQELEHISAAQEQLEEELKEEAEEQGLQLDQRLLDKYAALKEEANARTCKLAQDGDTAAARLKAEEESLRALEDTTTSITSRLAQLEADKAESAAHEQELQQKIKDAKATLKEQESERKKTSATLRHQGAQRDFLNNKMEEVEGKLKEARAQKHENERERKMKAALRDMKANIPGVYGRVTELASATSSKYNLALAVLLGKDMDSVIVDGDATAKACIEFLKKERCPPMTFYPLQTIRASPMNERLRHIGGSAKLVLDILEYDATYERAFLAICGNTLVCDTQDEAKRLAFGTERHKVVTLDGTLINRAGVMSGGISHNLENRAQRWDEKLAGSLREERAKFVSELAALPSEREGAQQEQQLTGEIAGLERQIEYQQQDLTATRERLQKIDTDMTALQKEQEKQAPEVSRLKRKISEQTNKVAALQKRINEMKDRIFAAFSEEVGVANIREYETNHLQRAEQAGLRRNKLKTQAAKINSQLAYEQRADLKEPLQKLEAEIRDGNKRIEKLKKEEEALAKAAEAVEAELESQSGNIAALRLSTETAEKEAAELRKAAARAQNELAKAKRAVGTHQAALDQLATRRADTLKASTMDQVELPRRDGNGAAPMETEEEAEGGAGPSASAGDDDAVAELDYSLPKREHRKAANAQKVEADFKAGIEAISSELERVAPNLKAVEQYEAIREKEAEQTSELEQARAAAKAATTAFTETSIKRSQLFTDCFQHISDRIDTIFKDLTRSRLHPVGGQAYLTLESSEEPFLHGIKFTAMPPTKRYREMDQLSGGEKTVAALALLFAIHSFQPSPFFVLDEVDAALDASNVDRVARYIRDKTRDGAANGFQSIVISLKDIFFEKADALVGVSRKPDDGGSAILTFDLNAISPSL